MSFEPVLNALAIPRDALVDQRIPKKLLVEQGAPTAADKRRIMDGIEELHWVAALKPTNIGVPAYKDATREYLEVAILMAELRAAAKAPRLIELIHRAIPYPLLLVSVHKGGVALSMAHKRCSQVEGGKVVIEEVRQISLNAGAPSPEEAAFLENIAVSRLPVRDLFALYDGWMDRLTALEAARITGLFAMSLSSERAAFVRDSAERYTRLSRELRLAKTRATKEKQINWRVQFNSEMRRLIAELAMTHKKLKEALRNETD